MKFDKITIAYFWSSSCYYCSLSMPDFRKLKDDYCLKGVDIISIHRPMNEFDLDEVKVFEVAKELGITEKLILDNDHTIGDEFGVEAWPTVTIQAC